jgi:glycosyltransferase involved in cell wall biosynthesis
MLNAYPSPRRGAGSTFHGIGAGARRVLVLSGDVLPYPGLPTTGAGLRAWGIAHGLASAGHDVTLLMPRHVLDKLALPEERHAELADLTFDTECIDNTLAAWQPDIVVVQHWWLANLVRPGDIPLVIDLHGPLMLETLYQSHAQYESLAADKLRAFSRADFITCAGELQQKYFYPWLMLAGFDLREPVIAAIPVSLSPDLPSHTAEGDVSFVYGGIYLPWQNPLVALSTLVERLEAHGRGTLHFFGGAHPVLKLAAAEYETIERQIRSSDRVTAHGLVSHDRLIEEYRRAHVAFDVMARNPERELAFTTRTVEYLWCGLPVVYNNYAELAVYIHDYEAGWTVNPIDREAIAAVVNSILADPAEVERRSQNARRLVRERLTWDRTIGPLDEFCRNPRKRRPRPLHLAAITARPDPAALGPELKLLVDQVEVAALQARDTAAMMDEQARRQLAVPAQTLTRVKQAAKRAVRLDRRLVLAEHQATLAGDFTAGATHGQSFVRGSGALYRIDVLFATFNRLNAARLRFHLCRMAPAGYGDDILTMEIPAARLRDNRFFSFVFPRLDPDPKAEYAFWLESPDATDTTTVAVWKTPAGEPAARRRFVNGRPVSGQLLCRIYESDEIAAPDGDESEREHDGQRPV